MLGQEYERFTLTSTDCWLASLYECATMKNGGAAFGLQSSRQREVLNITTETAILIVAIITATIAFATLIVRVIEVARRK